MNILDKYINYEYGSKKVALQSLLSVFQFSGKGIAPLTYGKRVQIFSLGLLLYALTLFVGLDTNISCLSADTDDQATDYCYVSNILINNQNTQSLTNYPVRMAYPYKALKIDDYFGSSHSNNFNDAKLWDLKGVYGALDNNVEFIGSDIRDSSVQNHYLWVVASPLQSGVNNLSILMNNDEQKRDQGIYLYDSGSSGYITDHNDLDFSSDVTVTGKQFQVHVDYKILDIDKINDEDIVLSKYDSLDSSGWKIEIDKATLSRFKCTIGTNPPVYSGLIIDDKETHRITLAQYNNAGTPYNYCQIDQEQINVPLDTNYWVTGTQIGIGANSKDISFGSGVGQFWIYDIGLINQVISNQYIARFTMNAWDISETDVINPFGYDIKSTINTNHSIAYELDAEQSNIETVFGEPKGLLESDITPYDDESVMTINPLNFSGQSSTQPNSIFGQFFNFGANTGTGNLVYSIMLIPIGLSFGAIAYIFTRSVLISSFVIGLPIMLGISIGLLPYWFGMLWIITLLISMGVKEFGRG
tara:strand:+ start:14762 stop:16345 length:1584 start_codon:yes stop_codon:yes gene_type:complete